MESTHLNDAIDLLEKGAAGFEPELLTPSVAKDMMRDCERAERLLSFYKAGLAARIDDATQLARITGTSIGKAKETVATGKVLKQSGPLSEALKHGDVSLDQANEIAKAEASAPGCAGALVEAARKEPFQVLKEMARKVKLEAEQHSGLAERQHAARSARSYTDELGMVHAHLVWEPHVGTPVVSRAEAEAQRMARAAKKNGAGEPFERYLADAYAAMLSGEGKGRAKRPELVVLVDYEVAKRGWTDVRDQEICKIPGVGPISPKVAKEIAEVAFLNAIEFDGKDLRKFKRWTRHIPIEVAIALELGDPPEFDGVKCADCGNRFHTEFDHIEPYAARGPTSHTNLEGRCWPCHTAKTERDGAVGKFKPPDP